MRSVGRSYIGAYWGARQEPVEQCADRLERCLRGLRDLDPSLSTWFKPAASRKSANEPVDVDPVALVELLLAGRNRTDFGNRVIERLGFEVSMWNGAEPSIGLSAAVGAYPLQPTILNNFLLRLPSPDEGAGSIYEPQTAEQLFRIAVESWSPEWATWTTRTFRRAQDSEKALPVVGWLTYLSGAHPVELPVGSAEPFHDGVLVKVSDRHEDATLDKVLLARDALASGGSLTPID